MGPYRYHELSQKLMRSPRYPLMFDESTDISVHQNLIVYIRLLECDMSSTVTTNTFYLSITDLHMANADAIYSKILLILSEKGLDISNLCGVCTDGAAVMVGTKSGIVTRLKQSMPGV